MQIALDILRGFVAYLLILGTSGVIFYFVVPGMAGPLNAEAKARAMTAVFGGAALLFLVCIVTLSFALRIPPVTAR